MANDLHGEGLRWMKVHDFDKVIRATLLENSEPWPVDVSEIPNYERLFEELGLSEAVPGETDTRRRTALGDHMNLDLLEVFLGMIDGRDVPWILSDYGVIDESQCLRLWALLPDDADLAPLRPIVIRAYLRAVDRGLARWILN